MGKNTHSITIVTGLFGAPIEETARNLAAAESAAYLSLDGEITRRDGRSIKRLVMMNGEHGYRNQEYEVLREIASDPARFLQETGCPDGCGALVIACGDGVLYDEDSRTLVMDWDLVIAGMELTTEALWARAKTIPDSYHAFMSFGTEDEKRRSFENLILRQRALFETIQKEQK